MARDRRRREEKAKRDKERAEKGEPPTTVEREKGEIAIGPDGVQITAALVPEPRFVSEAYFMDFKFEPGNYFLAGREKVEGRDVLRIEYYPTNFFTDDDPPEARKKDRGQEYEDRMLRRMNKTSLITLWVDPTEHQIVKYTFDNIWLDFLPGGWLVQVDEIGASMTMGQPFPGTWLPREIIIKAGVTLANGAYNAEYDRRFAQYRLAETSTKIRVPKAPEAPRVPERPEVPEVLEGAGPFVSEDPQPQEVIAEIRIHGNAYLADEEILKIAGVAVGQPLAPDGVAQIEKRLKDSGRFETVEVLKRFRSLTETDSVALILKVHEKPGIRSIADAVNPVLSPFRRAKSRFKFLPILNWVDGYGFTYGGRVSTIGLLGMGERLSVPLTWGGTRRAAVEIDRQFKTGPLTRVDGSFGIWNRENPRFEIRDQRVEARGRAEKVFADVVRTGFEASNATIEFGDLDDRLWTTTASVALDTRIDPGFPSNAILVSTGWTGLNFRSLPDRVDRYTTDARGYLRVFRQIVLAARAEYVAANATLPPYERLLMGGSGTLRGFSTGAFDGDRMFVTSAEIRAPITSVLSAAKLGVNLFMDAGKIWDFGGRMEDATWRQGVGGGVFLIAPLLRLNLDVAYGLKSGDTHVHLSTGFTF